MSNHSILQHVYLFKEMTPAEMDKVASIVKTASYNPGDEIFCEGDSATSLYIIKFGSVRIQQNGKSGDKIEVATLGTGSHFGEMAFVDGEHRSASVVAIEKTDILMMDYQTLNQFLGQNQGIAVKFYRSLAHFLCGRLRLTTNDLSYAREKNLRHF